MRDYPTRITPAAAGDLSAEQAELLGDWGSMNFASVMIHHPDYYKTFIPLIAKVIGGTNLPPHDRQILVHRTLAACDETYEANHHALISKTAGLDDAQIAQARDLDAPLTGFDQTLAQAADELVRTQRVADVTWAALAERYTQAQLMEVVGLVGVYVTMAMLTKSFGIQLEDKETFAAFSQQRDYV